MATFGTMMQALYDRLGLTGKTALVERLVNEAKDRVVLSAKWPFLENTVNLTVGSFGGRNYQLGAAVGHILAIYDSTGQPLEPIERVTYDRLYRADGSTANSPTVFTREHFSTAALANIHVWKSPQASTALALRYLVRVPDLADATSTQSFEQIPENLTIAITQAAEAALHENESSPQAQALEAKFQNTLARMAATHQAPVIDDGTR